MQEQEEPVEDAERFRAVLSLSSDWYWEQDEEFRFTAVIRHGSRQLSWEQRVLGKRRWELEFENMTPARWQEHRAVVERHRPFRDLELFRSEADGRRTWVSVSGEPVFDKHGAFRGYRGIGRDISDWRCAEHALRESEHRFKTFMENAPAVAWIKDGDLRYTYLNAQFEKMVGRRPDDLLGRHDLEVGWPEEAARVTRANDLEVLATRAPQQVVESAPHPDGTVHHWLNFKFPLRDARGRWGVAGMSVDITARVNREKEARLHSQEVRALYGRLVKTQEDERRRVAEQLHDLIGQGLVMLGVGLAALRRMLPPGVREDMAERIDALETIVGDTVESIRGVMTELRPAALEFGLASALQWYVSVFAQRTGIRATFEGVDARRLPRNVELDLFRSAQEALANIAKHSGARNACVSLRTGGGRAALSIADDGRGFSLPEGAPASLPVGWGLRSIRERAEAHGGALRVDAGEGGRLVVEVPLSDDD